MNPIVRKLAIDHLKWNKKKTFLEILIITLISASVFMVNLTVPRIRNIYRSWCVEPGMPLRKSRMNPFS